ncbi:hypothetical protein M409DRAFT_23734 [Zasmidium cellare ATCC 36951]|uniref:Uncharacterized protein n=1 Tax=Zasmidium cellare ATCC 36951 TaxID=1080233 RepID=A0A6A6CKR2_ZASCE|nr:uncharacterized protein M409DRAFT_23734 [Zasmidium cellare ATCC 36951]KAF2166006.1 hypothetical protein M409DRAFT_23734 [Zasmidium cellare ATCC 36951]
MKDQSEAMQSSKTATAVIVKQSSLRHQSSADSKTPIQICTVKSSERYSVHQFRQLFQQTNLTNKYYLAGTARSKLAYEVEEVDRNLLRLVAHANFLDRLQDEIDSAERLHETRHQARLVQSSVSPKKGSIVWEDVSDEERTSSDSEGEDEILELVRIPTRYQLPAKVLTKEDKAVKAKMVVGASQGVKAVLPRIVEEGEDDVESMLQKFDQEVVV